MPANISSGQGFGITRPGRAEDPTVKGAVTAATRAAKAKQVKSVKVKISKKA
jgi:hypothetical protein